MKIFKKKENGTFPYPGKRIATDGNGAVIYCEREASDAAGAYPITPSTQMGEYWSEEVAKGHINTSERPLIFIEPESEHAAAAVTAGMSMTGLRAINFSSAQGVAFMHESLYSAVGKRLPYVLNIGCRAITKASLNVHCGHDDYHCIDDTGFIQIMAKSGQAVADLNLIAHKIAELSLTPAAIAQDGFLTTHLIESLNIPERALIAEYLGKPEDVIDTPTAAQRMIYGEKRRRIPLVWDVDNPMVAGMVQNQDAYMQSVAAQRPYFFEHIPAIADQCLEEYYQLTGRRYQRVEQYLLEDADYIILGQGSMIVQAELVAEYLRKTRKLKVGVVNMVFFRPFPGELLTHLLKGKKGVTILERTDQPLAEDLPLMRETRAALNKCLQNALADGQNLPYPEYAVFEQLTDMPRLYSGAYGLGSRDLQPEALIGVVENMLPTGEQRPFFYLSIDFIHNEAESPKQEIYQKNLERAYPDIKNLAIRGSENPNLMPDGSITVRMHSVGGWGAITTGKNLVMTLFDLLGYHIKANPKYGSDKKGLPTTYFLSAAPEPIRLNCEYHYVDVVLSPDPNVFEHSNPLAGLKKGGTLIIQSVLTDPKAVWAQFPISAQKTILENELRIFYIDGFKIAKEEAKDPSLEFRMQGIAFQGAFFAASTSLMESAGFDEKKLFRAIEDQLESKFGAKGKKVVEANLRVVKRGFNEIQEVTDKQSTEITTPMLRREIQLPMMLKNKAASTEPLSDIQRFWEQTGNFYANGQAEHNLADPFLALSLIPVSTSVFRDMTQIRFNYPIWNAENCTACGDCYTVCPDTAIPGLVSTISDTFNTVINQIENQGRPTMYLRRAVRGVEKELRALIEPEGVEASVNALLPKAIETTLEAADEQQQERLSQEFEWFMDTLGDFKFSITKPFYQNLEKKNKGTGGLFSITINPYTCKGCMECVTICEDDALTIAPQTTESIKKLRQDWAFWLKLPTTPEQFSRIDDLDEGIGALETLLLNKHNYDSLVCGDGACMGCGEKTAIHLFTATVTALMQPRVKTQLAKIEKLIQDLERHIRLKLAETLDLSDVGAIKGLIDENQDKDLTLGKLTAKLDEKQTANLVDAEWLEWVTKLLDKLKHLKWQYVTGTTQNGRAEMGIINATGCTSVWGATFPYNPYPFPWANHLFQDTPSMAMGIFEGHMVKMAEGFKAIRMAELEVAGQYHPEKDKDFFTYFNWKQFSDEEFRLCPPVVALGGDGAMYDIGFQNLSRMMMSGMPIKTLIVDTQVYSNTGGQACTSGFISQVSDMAPYSKKQKGKEEIRKEITTIAMGHRSSYVLQGTISNITHLLEGYIEGLNSRLPALFNIYAVCPPEHGVGDDVAEERSKLAVESRAYPLFKYNPEKGHTFQECSTLEGNPALDDDWPTYTLKYTDGKGKDSTLSVPMTFADFAFGEGRFAKHFRKAPPETWNDDMLPLDEFIALEEDDREGLYPYIWAVDKKNSLNRVVVSQELVRSSEERLNFWRLLKSLTGIEQAIDVEEIAQQTRSDMMQKISAGLMAMVTGDGIDLSATMTTSATTSTAPAQSNGPEGYEPVWIETPECTTCDECIDVNSKIFAYNDKNLAIVADPKAGTFKDIVKAAEKCSASAIHPGTPWNPNEPGVEKLIKRAEKFQ
jgi:pyruvate-ferredoxin/flavodoxin oxidoreductase